MNPEVGALPDFSMVTNLIKTWPLVSMLLVGGLFWFLRHRGIGANFLPGWAAKPKEGTPLTQQVVATVAMPAAVSMDPLPNKADHPAVNVLRAGIEAGVGKAVLPAVDSLLTGQKTA